MAEHWQIVNGGKIQVSNDPEGLWRDACRYFEWCDKNPIESEVVTKVGKAAGIASKEKKKRPYSVKGFCLHCGILEEYIQDVRQSKAKDSLYYIVVSKILYIIYIQNLELATVGIYNPIFVAKVLNMEKDETPSSAIKIDIISGLPELSRSENEILEKLELENQSRQNSNS